MLEKGEFNAAVFEVGRQFGKLPRKKHVVWLTCPLEPRRVAPTRQPLEQLDSFQAQRLPLRFAPGVNRLEPLNKRPIPRRKQLLLVRRARGQVNRSATDRELFARAGPEQQELEAKVVQPRLVFPGECPGEDAQCARGPSRWFGVGGSSQTSIARMRFCSRSICSISARRARFA